VAGLLLAAAVGYASASTPQTAAVGAALLLAVALAFRHTSAAFGAALLLLAYSPENLGTGGVLSHPELQKGAVYLSLLPLMIARGVHPRMLLPLATYVVLAVLAVLHDDLTPGLGIGQMSSTYVTLTVGWSALAVKWRGTADLGLLKIVTTLPLVCVALGLVLQVAGLHEMIQAATTFDPVARLRGASIASQLALTSFVSCIAATVLWRTSRWTPAPYVLVANIVILGATASRGAAIALVIALAGPTVRHALSSLRRDRTLGLVQLAALVIVAGVVLATVVPRLESRNSGGRYYAGAGTITDSSSGRDEAWREFYAIAKQSPLFGHGLGSGPITKIEQSGFQAQHNEYLRFFLEGGYVGGGLVLFSIVLAVGFAIASAPRRIRLDLVGAALGVAFLSITDNTLTSINLIVPFGLLLGISASLPGERKRRRRLHDPVEPAGLATA
jgi:teichuronic acid biosynthesis protein TuaE